MQADGQVNCDLLDEGLRDQGTSVSAGDRQGSSQPVLGWGLQGRGRMGREEAFYHTFDGLCEGERRDGWDHEGLLRRA